MSSLPDKTSPERRVEEAVRDAAAGGRLSCARGLALARRLRVEPVVIGQTADRLGIKIEGCQLGCFR